MSKRDTIEAKVVEFFATGSEDRVLATFGIVRSVLRNRGFLKRQATPPPESASQPSTAAIEGETA